MPQRFTRPVTALLASGIAVMCTMLTAVPAPAAAATRPQLQEWWLSKLAIKASWVASRGAGVTVAVLSDGIDGTQADLTQSVTQGPDYTGAKLGGPYFGEQGTEIASLIAGHGHGRIKAFGIMGVAPEASILSIQVTLPGNDPQLGTDASSLTGWIARGITYAVNHGARVIDLPLDPGQPGQTGTDPAAAAAGGSAAERAAVSYALKNNVLLVAPAGDNGANGDAVNYPAAYPGVISVGAFNSAFVKAPFSNQNSYVTLTAAGVDAIAATPTGYTSVSSTIAASAVVAGIATLIRARFPGLTVAQVKRALIHSTVYRPRNGASDGSGYGTVNAARALAVAGRMVASTAPAGANAVPGGLPAAPGGVLSSGFGSTLLRDLEISLAVLFALLLLITPYALAGRRKTAKELATAAEWGRSRPAQPRYADAATDADKMLEYFSAPAGRQTRDAAPTRPSGNLARTGAESHSPFIPAPLVPTASPASPPDGSLFAPTGRRIGPTIPVTGLGAAPSAMSSGSWTSGSGGRPVVSGAPPWEPASAPEGELPWTARPGAPRPVTQQRGMPPSPIAQPGTVPPGPAGQPGNGPLMAHRPEPARAETAQPPTLQPPTLQPPTLQPGALQPASSRSWPGESGQEAATPATPATPAAPDWQAGPGSLPLRPPAGAGFGDPGAASVTGTLGSSLWNTTGSRSWPASDTAGGTSDTDTAAAGQDEATEPSQDGGPSYRWNPGASTDAFPAVRGDLPVRRPSG